MPRQEFLQTVASENRMHLERVARIDEGDGRGL
jgi:hypothetical protein